MSTERCGDTIREAGEAFSLSQQMSMIFRLWCNRWPWHSSRWWVSIYETVQPTMQRTQEQCNFRKERSQLHRISQNWVPVQIFIGLQAAAITAAGLMRRWPKNSPNMRPFHCLSWSLSLSYLTMDYWAKTVNNMLPFYHFPYHHHTHIWYMNHHTHIWYMNHGYHWLHCNLSIIGRILVIGLFFGHFVQ